MSHNNYLNSGILGDLYKNVPFQLYVFEQARHVHCVYAIEIHVIQLSPIICYTIYIMLSNGKRKTPLLDEIEIMREIKYICILKEKTR